MKIAILTGGNGFIGSRLVLRLLQDGWQVHAIGRGKDGLPWRGRLVAALGDIGGKKIERGLLVNMHCHEVDLSKSDLGLVSPARDQFPGQIRFLFHVAGDTRFTPTDPEFQRRLNVDGSVNVVQALGSLVARVVHVSTAYVAGDREGLIKEEDLYLGQGFHNSYERSKLDAELAVLDLCKSRQIPLVIVRPSIIINDTQTGRSSTFTHLNALVEVINRIQEYYGLRDGEVVSKQIRMLVDPEARPNLAPVDPIVEALLKIAVHPKAVGKIFHLSHPEPQPNIEVVGLIAEAFGVTGKVDLAFVRELQEPVSRTEKMFVRSLKVYSSHMNSRCHFDLTNTRSIIPDYDLMFGPLDLAYVRKVINFERVTRQ